MVPGSAPPNSFWEKSQERKLLLLLRLTCADMNRSPARGPLPRRDWGSGEMAPSVGPEYPRPPDALSSAGKVSCAQEGGAHCALPSAPRKPLSRHLTALHVNWGPRGPETVLGAASILFRALLQISVTPSVRLGGPWWVSSLYRIGGERRGKHNDLKAETIEFFELHAVVRAWRFSAVEQPPKHLSRLSPFPTGCH